MLPSSRNARVAAPNISRLATAILILAACVFTALPVQAAIPQQERDALIALYNSTNGPHWKYQGGWLGLVGSECGWYGISCDTARNTVTGVQLTNLSMSGSLPAQIGNLTNLQTLGLNNNQIAGSIPPQLGNLKNLWSLVLDFNQLSGSIPPELGQLANLQILKLDANQLSGSIPQQLGSLTNLSMLDLNSNRLTGSIPPQLGNLSMLRYLNLWTNSLSGSIPSSLGSLRNLVTLNLDNNQLSGPMPPELANLANLQTLSLAHNQLTGALPAFLGSLARLYTLILRGNHFSGAIPPQLGNLTNLQTLDLALNSLSGPIPSELGKLGSLRILRLDGNQLVGDIPLSLASLPYLFRLNIEYNALYTNDTALSDFLTYKESGWEYSQTVAPTHFSALAQSSSSILVSWTPIIYRWNSGRYQIYQATNKGGPYTVAASTADKWASSVLLTGLTPGTYYFVANTVTDPVKDNANTVTSEFSAEVSVTTNPKPTVGLPVNSTGAATASTVGSQGALQTGYATMTGDFANAPYATAVLSYQQDGLVLSETAMPASPPTTAARLFVEYRTGVAVPGSAAKVDIYTALAAVNRGEGPATITFTLRSLDGQVITSGTGSLARNAHFAKYITQLSDILPGFSIPPAFPTSTRFGTLELSSNQPLSVVAMRLTINQRGETLLKSTPIADLTQAPVSTPVYLPQLADGGGYVTSVILLGTSGVAASGTLRFYANNGAPLTVRQLNGAEGSSFTYSILPNGAYLFQTDGSRGDVNVGWVEITPGNGTSTPAAAGFFQFSPDGVTVTESEIPSARATTHARVFVDNSENRETGLAFGNPGSSPVNITMTAFQMNGSPQAGAGQGLITLAGKGHMAVFAHQVVAGLPAGFRGVLDITGNAPFVPLTSRALINERGDFLMTAFPAADLNQPAAFPICFPQIADGGGYTTEFILLGAGASGAVNITFFGDNGTALAIGK